MANGGNDRLVVSTISTHLVFFHEAGFEYRTERRQRTPKVWWNPATWRGYKWTRTADAEQPRDVRCTDDRGMDLSELGATSQSSPGFFKSTYEHMSIRRHCVWVAVGDPAQPGPAPAADEGARNVRDVLLRFDYGGQVRTLRHSTRG